MNGLGKLREFAVAHLFGRGFAVAPSFLLEPLEPRQFLSLTAPSGLEALPADNTNRIDVRWTDNATSEEGYYLERRVGAGTWSRIAILGANETRYRDFNDLNSPVLTSTTYEYRAQAFEGAAVSGWSELLTAGSGSATTPGFQTLDNLLFGLGENGVVTGPLVPQPKLERLGMDYVYVAHASDIFDSGNNVEPVRSRVEALADKVAPTGKVLMIDIEHWPLDIRVHDPLLVDDTIRKFVDIATWIHLRQPSVKLGFYAAATLRDYWTPVNYQNSPGNASYQAKYADWQAAHDYIKPIADAEDVHFPSLYTFYDMTVSANVTGWDTYARHNSAESRRTGGTKPVLPYLWMRYHTNNLALNNQYMPASAWRHELDYLRTLANLPTPTATGLTAWGGYQESWNENAGWWQETESFLQAKAAANLIGQVSTALADWKGVYGADGYNIAGHPTSLPAGVAVAVQGSATTSWPDSVVTVAPSTENNRYLQKPDTSTNRTAAAWNTGTSIGSSFDIQVTLDKPRVLTIYAVDSTANLRKQRLDVIDTATGRVLDSRTLESFHDQGSFLRWHVDGDVTIRVTNLVAGQDAVVSGIFIDSAPYKALVDGYQGNWVGWIWAGSSITGYRFGNRAYRIAKTPADISGGADATMVGPITAAQTTVWGQWASSSTAGVDLRALVTSPTSSSRIASAWEGASTFGASIQIDLNLSSPRKVSIYAVDWVTGSPYANDRVQRLDVTDLTTGRLMDSRILREFSHGAYVSWQLSGNVRITVTSLVAGQSAVVSGLFLDPATSSLETAAEPASTSPAQELRRGQVLRLAREAAARWIGAGARLPQLANIRFVVADLPGNVLGMVSGKTVTLDIDAAGHGWFIDPTPRNDSEFRRAGNQGEEDRIDLLSVLAHEIGHVLGLEHGEEGMEESLMPGARWAPAGSDHSGASGASRPDMRSLLVASSLDELDLFRWHRRLRRSLL